MYKCYRLENSEELKDLVSSYEECGKQIMEGKKANIRKDLDEYLRKDGFIDFTNMQEDWFPAISADVFISHSHKDISLINALVGWLTIEFKVDVFVDSYIWGYCNDLLKEIDEEYCRHSNGVSYDYDKRNISTTHVHMMLSNSLNKMIDKTECVLFVETDNSLSVKNNIETGTTSAWIYSELITTSLISRRIPKRLNNKNVEIREKYSGIFHNEINSLYRVDLSHLIKLDISDLKEISQKELKGEKPYLDELYKTVNAERVLNG
ncbi:hypothetical protein [Clostridium sp.]|uniref:hypothetical protein n=1 Tax=Clostridium sp. TaxID=1506 RepID=UPI0025B9162B|nr:hypothetical protein [Clostridium sp.]